MTKADLVARIDKLIRGSKSAVDSHARRCGKHVRAWERSNVLDQISDRASRFKSNFDCGSAEGLGV